MFPIVASNLIHVKIVGLKTNLSMKVKTKHQTNSYEQKQNVEKCMFGHSFICCTVLL